MLAYVGWKHNGFVGTFFCCSFVGDSSGKSLPVLQVEGDERVTGESLASGDSCKEHDVKVGGR
jgi:hypothetical protein